MEKYRLSFSDSLDTTWKVSFYFDAYNGAILPLQGSANPLVFNKNGDESDLFSPIIKSQFDVSLIETNLDQFISDTTDIGDLDVFVSVTNSNNYKWYGYLIPDERSENMSGVVRTSVLCIDVLSCLNSKQKKRNTVYLTGRTSIFNALSENIKQIFPNGINPTFIDNSSITTDGGKLLTKSFIDSEIFYNSDGTLKNVLDVVSSIMQTFGMVCYQSNGEIHFSSMLNVSENQQYKKTITIGGEEDLLLSVDNYWTNTRPIKKASIKFDYNRDFMWIIKNPYFIGYSNGDFTNWTKNLHLSFTGLEQIGNGSDTAPYVARIHGFSTYASGNTYNQPPINDIYFASVGGQLVKKGQTLTIKIKFRHPFTKYHNTQGYSDTVTPNFQFGIAIVPDNNMTADNINRGYLLEYDTTTTTKWTNDGAYLASGHLPLDPNIGLSYKADAYNDIQEIELTTPELKNQGYVYINIYPMFYDWDSTKTAISKTPIVDYLDIMSVLITASEDVNLSSYPKVNYFKSETHTLTQNGTQSKEEEELTAILSNVPSFLSNAGITMETGILWGNMYNSSDGFLTSFINRFGSFGKVLKAVLRENMYLQRRPRMVFNGKVYSNTILEHSILEIDGLKTFVLTDKYDIVSATHEIVAHSLTGLDMEEIDVFNDPVSSNKDYYTLELEQDGVFYGIRDIRR